MDGKISFEELKTAWWDEKQDIESFSIGSEPSLFTPKQFDFFNDRTSRSILLSGAYRSGKTDVMMRKCVLLSLIFPGNEGLIGRKTSTELEVTVLPHLQEICDSRLFQYRPKQGVLEFINGSKIYLRGLDVLQGSGEQDTKKAIEFIRGLNLGWFAVDQAEGVEHIIVEHLEARLSRKVPFHQAMLTSNPTNFWAYDIYKKSPRKGYKLIEMSMMDNAHNLPEDYVEKQKELEAIKPRYYKQYVLGIWDEFMTSENIVFEERSLDKLRLAVREPLREWEGFKIYVEPNDRHVYQVGADPTEGKKDNGSISVVDLTTGEEVAKYAKCVLYDILASKVAKVCELYNTKRVVPESNNYAFLMELANHKGLRLYQDKSLGKEEEKITPTMGYRMTRDKKLYLVDNMEKLLSTGKAVVYDRDTVDEFHAFVHDGTKMGAREGAHDDRVIATLLAFLDVDPENPKKNPQALSPIQRELMKYQMTMKKSRVKTAI